jgi:hypothetical protein
VRHKERNVLEHLPERDRPAVKTRMRRAWASDNHALALDGLRQLAGELDRSHPGAAASLREGLEETLTLTRLGIRSNLKRTLQSTNPSRAGRTGTCACAGRLPRCSKPNRQFRKIIGYADLAKLANAVERDLAARHPTEPVPTTIATAAPDVAATTV